MIKLYKEMSMRLGLIRPGIRMRAAGFIPEERGDLVSSLGWMAIMFDML